MSDTDSADEDLRKLLCNEPIDDWAPIFQRVQLFPKEVRQRHYRNESPLHLSLKLRERRKSGKREKLESEAMPKGKSRIKRMQVLQVIVDADPSSVIIRDEEGRTPLHTASRAGRSWEILQFLFEAEDEFYRQRKYEGCKIIKEQERSATLRTDHPGGDLPLHLIAACPSFDESSFEGNNDFFPYAPLDEDAIHCSISQNIVSAYKATTTVREAYVQAVWDRNCDGEIPLHAAATWGNVGAVLSLLLGAALLSIDGPCDAAQTVDDRSKTPLDRACERVCALSVHEKPARALIRGNFRKSVSRADPFMSNSTRGERAMNRDVLLSVNPSRLRIPGIGSSFGSSFTSTSSIDPPNVTMLRDSFVSSRRPVDPVLGLKPLCDDGNEEFAKVEMLVRANKGYFNVDFGSHHFLLLHAIIELGCPPEIVWHAAIKYPHEVELRDGFGKSPLFLAAEAYQEMRSRHKQYKSSTIPQQEVHELSHSDGIDINDEINDIETSEAEAARNYFVQSFFLGNDSQINLNGSNLPFAKTGTSLSRVKRVLKPNPDHPDAVEEIGQSKTNDEEILSYQEIICMLIKSKIFGKPVMASIQDSKGRLALHILLEAGALWVDDDFHETKEESNAAGGDVTRRNYVIPILIDAYPQSLMIRNDETGLFPFMIAATNVESDDEIAVLETVFKLLSQGPEAISYFVNQL